MSAQPAEPVRPLAVEVLDPNSPEGIAAAAAISEFGAEVITRLRREGKPVPGRPHNP